jgi:hypothetical protein
MTIDVRLLLAINSRKNRSLVDSPTLVVTQRLVPKTRLVHAIAISLFVLTGDNATHGESDHF